MKAQGNVAVAVEEQRRERRYPTNDPVQVRPFPYTTTPLPANIVDVSRSGMKLELVMPLPQHIRVEVMMLESKAVIFGEVRYCRRSGAVYHAGVLIEDVVQSKPDRGHLSDDEMSLYIVGKGLTASEVIRVETHIFRCNACKQKIVETTKALYPRQRRLTVIDGER